MPLRIIDVEGGWELEVPIRDATLEALRLQIDRIQRREVFLSPVCEKIGQKISETVLDVLDPDLRPPTEPQVQFAIAIARELNINLPGEALQFRGAMHDFLQRFSPLFYSRKNRPLV